MNRTARLSTLLSVALKDTCFVLLFLCLFLSNLHAKTIAIPEDASTLLEAIQRSSNGDEIVLHQSTYWTEPKTTDEEVTTQFANKDVVIRGDRNASPMNSISPQEDFFYSNCGDTIQSPTCSVVWMENSNIHFENVQLNCSSFTRTGTGSHVVSLPISVVNGSLTLTNCDVYGLMNIRGNVSMDHVRLFGVTTYSSMDGPYQYFYSTQRPVLKIHSSSDVVVDIRDSVIDCPTNNSYLAMELSNLQRSQVRIAGTEIRGGTYAYVGRSGTVTHPFSEPGGYGMKISSCTDLECHFTETRSIGGSGFGGASNPNQMLIQFPSGKGGAGLWIENSNIEMIGGTFLGGQGGKGNLWPYGQNTVFRISGDGGCGIKIQTSKVQVSSVSASGGAGGEGEGIGDYINRQEVPSGDPGAAIELDGQSTYAPLEVNRLQTWERY